MIWFFIFAIEFLGGKKNEKSRRHSLELTCKNDTVSGVFITVFDFLLSSYKRLKGFFLELDILSWYYILHKAQLSVIYL